GRLPGFSKVSRCKSGTVSSHYRRNGYTHRSGLSQGAKKRRSPFLKEAPFFQARASSSAFFQQAQALW
ncbi:hypothetical protein, partial [Pseudomonas palleroniana]|uniref:hypothetical protein n=1 Tax=Pseudomonas palleroniana TaxID=191390 RepID=UPI001BAF77F6